MSSPTIGYIGLGSLGSAIFPHLAKHACDTSLPAPIVWNRSQNKYAALKDQFPHAITAKDVTELAEKADVIFTCLVNDAAAEDVYEKVLAGLKPGKKVVFADQTTLKVSTAQRIKEKVEKAGAIYVTNTVFGQPAAARAKQLVCVLAGPVEGRDAVRPLLDVIGKKTIDVGDDNGKGASLKLLGNSIILGAIQLYSESYALADAIGFDPAVFHELHENVFAAPALLNYSNKISKGAFGDAGFTVTTGLKDAGHILSLGQDFGKDVLMPTIQRAQKSLEKVKELGHGDLDWAAAAAVARVEAGLPPFKEGTQEGRKSAA